MIRYYLFAFFIAFFVSSCAPKKEIIEAPVYEEREFDTMVVAAAPVEDGVVKEYIPEVYRASATRDFDLIHTLLRISFDWKNQRVLGKAELTLNPWFYTSEMLELDAVNFDFHEISLDGKPLKYDYDNEKVQISLDREYARQDTFTIFIDYTAKPNEGPTEGSLAITSSKGLFFIDPLDKDPEKPSQIWTQGETENNSRWFPTIDKPNERCSQEIFLTVDDKYETLSNGRLVNSVQNDDGTRTDHWHQEKPHAPYLFMVGVGEYAVVRDKWRKIPLSYYVEPAFKNHAKKIFAHTPEMMEFFPMLWDIPIPGINTPRSFAGIM